MKLVDASLFYDENIHTEEQLLQQHYTTVGWAEALQRRGVEVIVMKRFHRDSSLRINNVQYYFIKDQFAAMIKSWQIPWKLLKKISSTDPDIIQLHNFSRSPQTFLLRLLLKKESSIVIQHHGGPTPKGTKKTIDDLLNGVADGFFFTTVEQGKQWFKTKKLHGKIMPVMEGATFFNYNDRDASRVLKYHDRNAVRKQTGMIGSPVFLWVGRLDHNKDPLTVLTGFENLVKRYETALLYMIYSEDKLLDEVMRRIEASAFLKNKVFILGKVPHEEIEKYYSSSDYFVLGSHYEGSGYALSEALRCGCVPIVTDIPSFRMMTNDGQLGALWQPGNVTSFVEAAIFAMNKPLQTEANACIDFFTKNLSFDAIAETAMNHYKKLMESRSRKKDSIGNLI